MYDLLVRLRDADLGSHRPISEIYCGTLFYVDDIILLSGSVVKLQAILDVRNEYGMMLDVKFNADR